MKKFFVLALSSVGLTALSPAFVNFNFTTPYLGPVANTAGNTVTWMGTVTVSSGWDVTGVTIEAPALSTSGPSLAVVIDPGFAAYVAGANVGVGYSGAIASYTFDGTEAVGFYGWDVAPGGGLSPFFSEITVVGNLVSTDLQVSDSELYGVDVVPEPATLLALSAGALALVRRRRKA
ncbi:MAG: PEP-CTERM sorting domain-containing protein [Fimbriimonadaceae bacterium]